METTKQQPLLATGHTQHVPRHKLRAVSLIASGGVCESVVSVCPSVCQDCVYCEVAIVGMSQSLLIEIYQPLYHPICQCCIVTYMDIHVV